MRIFRAAMACCLLVTQSGCADILPWPGFESHPAIFSYTEQIPASEVAAQVRCELADFVAHDGSAGSQQLLDPNGGAQVQLKLTTDLQGSVSYLGINLSKLGLGPLANLVTTSGNAPSLQLKAQGKATTVSQIDFVIPQTVNSQIKYYDQTSKKISPQDLPPNLVLRPCHPAGVGPTVKYIWFYLWLDDALTRYQKRIYAAEEMSGTFYDHVCQPKLTINTQFQLLFDVSAGTNIYNSFPVILPISGLNVDASPDYTHFLQIAFTLKQDEQPGPPSTQKAIACDKLQPKNSPPHA